MKLLLDSMPFFGWLAEDSKLSAGARQAVADPSSIVHVSAATVWEFVDQGLLSESSISTVPTCSRRSRRTTSSSFRCTARALPRRRNPAPPSRRSVRRMLIAQAQIEGLTIVHRTPRFVRTESPSSRLKLKYEEALELRISSA